MKANKILGINRARLRGLRVEKGFTQEKMASAIGISTLTYIQKEKGRCEFSEGEILCLSKILGEEIANFFAK